METYFVDYLLPYLKKNSITHLWHLGDFFENRKQLGVQTLNVVSGILDKFHQEQIQMTIIKGNHDLYYNNTDSVSSIDPIFSRYDNIRVISRFEELNFFGTKVAFMNWITPDRKDDANRFLQETSATVLCGHFKINSFEVIKGVLCETGVDPFMFERFDRVLSGHFHIRATNRSHKLYGEPLSNVLG